MRGNAMRFAQGVDGVAVQIRDGLAVDFICRAAVKLHVARQGHCVSASLL